MLDGIGKDIGLSLAVERSFGITDEVTIEVQCLVAVVFSRGWGACLYDWSELKLQFLPEISLYDLNVCHTIES